MDVDVAVRAQASTHKVRLVDSQILRGSQANRRHSVECSRHVADMYTFVFMCLRASGSTDAAWCATSSACAVALTTRLQSLILHLWTLLQCAAMMVYVCAPDGISNLVVVAQ
jgi:hypothetical protein